LSFIALAQIPYFMKTQLVKNIAKVFALFISSIAFAQHDHGAKSDTSKASHKHECQMKKGGGDDKAMACCGKGKMKKGKAMSCHSDAKSDSTKHDHSNHEGMMDKKKKSTSCH
jgi:hypothetical protein